MSKPAKSVASETSTDLSISFDPNAGSFEKVDLSRVWYRPTEGARIMLSLLERSGDVRELYPSDYPGQNEQPLFAWAAMLLMPQDAGPTSPFFGNNEENIALAPGKVFFLFEPQRLRDVFIRLYQKKKPFALGSPRLDQNVKSKKYGKVKAWQWTVDEFSKPFHPPQVSLVMPTNDAPLLLPSHEGFESE